MDADILTELHLLIVVSLGIGMLALAFGITAIAILASGRDG